MSLGRLPLSVCLSVARAPPVSPSGCLGRGMEGWKEGREKKDECTSCVSENECVFECESVGSERGKKRGGWSLFENSN